MRRCDHGGVTVERADAGEVIRLWPDGPPFRIVEGLHAEWTRADRPAELHRFARGAHGFGMVRQGAPSDRWPDLFLAWLADLALR